MDNIIEGLRRNDEKSLKIIYDKYYQLIYYLVLRILRSKLLAEDMAQEAFMKMLDNIKSLKDNRKFLSWFCLLTINNTNSFLAKEKMNKKNERLYMEEYASDRESRKNLSLVEYDRYLSATENEIITLHEKHDLTYNQIGEILNMSTSSVKKLYSRAIEKLQESLRS